MGNPPFAIGILHNPPHPSIDLQGPLVLESPRLDAHLDRLVLLLAGDDRARGG